MASCIGTHQVMRYCLLFMYSATCRRPIHGAAGRPARPLDLWPEESLLQQRMFTTTKSSLSHIHSPASHAPSFSPQSELRPRRRSFSIWLKLLVFLMLAASLYYVFQNVSNEQIDSCLLFLQDRVFTPFLTAIGVISQEEKSGSEWMHLLPVFAWAVSVFRLEAHPHLIEWTINILAGFVLIIIAIQLLSHIQLCVLISL